ncbi:MAG: carbohydrate ABC transporter permease [Fimbriimonadaceae bacterium]
MSIARQISIRPRSIRRQSALRTIGIHTVLLFFSIVFMLPLIWMIATSLKPIEETMRTPPTWIPSTFQWHNYPDALTYGAEQLGYIPFLVYFRNTVVLCVLVVAGAVLSNALAGYAFGRLKWKGRDVFFALTLATMMVPFPVLMVPIFALFRELGWIGTFRPLWVPAWFGAAFNIFLLRQFFKALPFELSEAAKIDGCSEWGIFWRVVLPLSKPALAVVALFTFMGTWNDFLGPLIYLLDQRTFTLALGLQFYQSQHGGTQWNMLMAACTVVVAPVIVLFFFTQKQFIQGIAATGLKG